MVSIAGTAADTAPLGRRRAEGTAAQERPFGPRFMTPMLMGATLNPVNSSVIATALVSIAVALRIPVGQTSILISSLYLTSAVAQPTAGRLSEEFGPRRVFLAGAATVLAAGIAGGLARNLTALVVARVLIGLGTSAGYPSAMLLLRRRSAQAGLEATPPSVLGGLAIAGAATIAIGPAIGGLLVGWFNWRAAFEVNIPGAGLAFVMALLWIPKDPDSVRGRGFGEIFTRIDVPGVLGFGGSMTALLVFLLALPRPDWIALGVTLALAAALVAWELRSPNPFLDIRLLASNLPLTRTYLRFGLTQLGIYVILFGLTQWVEAARGLSAYQAGLLLIPMGLLSAVTARVASRRTGHPQAAAGRGGLHAARVGRRPVPDQPQPSGRHRRRHGAVRAHVRNAQRDQPGGPVPGRAGREGRHRGRAAADLRLCRLDRLGDHHRHHLPRWRG